MLRKNTIDVQSVGLSKLESYFLPCGGKIEIDAALTHFGAKPSRSSAPVLKQNGNRMEVEIVHNRMGRQGIPRV